MKLMPNHIQIFTTKFWNQILFLLNNFWMANKHAYLNLPVLALVALVLSFSSCKKEKFNPNSTGKGILSDDDLLGLNTIDTTITIYSYPVLADPVFGLAEASIYSQFVFSNAKDFTTEAKDGILSNLTVDSIILSMPISNIYGVSEPQIFEVYQLNEQMSIDDDYYSNQTLLTELTNLVEIGKEIITPSLSDGSIDLFLSTALGDDIIAQNGTSTLSSNSDFISWFKGLHITTNSSQSSGEGSIVNILTGETSDSTTLTMYYHDTDAPTTVLSFEMRIDESTARFNHFAHDYSGTDVENALNNKDLGNSEFYIQSMAGVNTEIDLPFIKNLSNTENLVIRKAELILPFQESSTYDENEDLMIKGYDDENELEDIDFPIASVNTSDNNYTFNIPNFINQILRGDDVDSRLLIFPLGAFPPFASIIPNRTIFNGQKSAEANKIELKISYTIF